MEITTAVPYAIAIYRPRPPSADSTTHKKEGKDETRPDGGEDEEEDDEEDQGPEGGVLDGTGNKY